MQPSIRSAPILLITGLIYLLLGAALVAAGIWLLILGGTAAYVLIGGAIFLSALLLLGRYPAALWVYALTLIGTIAWALYEVGLDWWPLAARGDIIFPMGLWLLFPWITRPLAARNGQSYFALTGPLWLGIAIGAVVLIASLFADRHEIDATLATVSPPPAGAVNTGTADGTTAGVAQPAEDWRSYGGTQFGQRYSLLDQITPSNVAQLKIAWVFRTGDTVGDKDPVETTFEVTPIKVGDTLYLCSQHQRLFAVDARTGQLRWSYDPEVRDNPTFQHLTCRGVSYHETPPGAVDSSGNPPPNECPKRIFLPVNDGRMIALDAATGHVCTQFGKNGTLDLEEGMGETTSGFYEPTSPPVVGDKILVVAGSVIDNYSTREPSGVIRGFDIYTGKLVWAWDAGAVDENALPTSGRTYTNNSPNSWITASYDAKLGLVYIPMGVQTPDIWGGSRTAEAERYSSSLVALDINTGKRIWSFQGVHHDLWDMDFPAQPSLVDLQTAAGIVPAILQPAKTGDLFVLDRRDGRPVVPVTERPVPQGAAPGDHVAPTQPFSALSFRPEANLSGADMWGATIFDQLACRIQFHRLRYEGIFTPPSLQGTLVFPGNLGMFEWGGVAVDPVRQIAIANPISIPFVSQLMPRGPNNPAAPNSQHPTGSEIGVQPMYGTPFGVQLRPFLSPLGLPCLRPPWGYMAAIDLRSMKIAWMHRNGTVRDSAPLPLPFKMGVPSLGGPLTTAGGVAFLTSTTDYYIRAYNVTDGTQLWQDRLPAGGQSTPMSYALDGRQYIVTAAGGHGSFGTKRGDYVIAYSLKE